MTKYEVQIGANLIRSVDYCSISMPYKMKAHEEKRNARMKFDDSILDKGIPGRYCRIYRT